MKTLNVDYTQQYNCRDDSALKVSGITYIQAADYPEWSFPLHSHSDALELSLVVGGRGELYYDRGYYTMKRGDLIIKNANVPHSEKALAGDPLEQLCVSLSGVRVTGHPPDELLVRGASPVVESGGAFEFLKGLFFYLLDMCERKPAGYEAALHDTAKSLLSCVAMLARGAAAQSETERDSAAVTEIIRYIDENYMKNISLEMLSRRFHFSPYYLARKFKDETGYAVNQYVINRRMGEAERMLLYENLSIKEIAQKTGYSNLQYFYATFKKYAGCAPAEFRNLYCAGIAEEEK